MKLIQIPAETAELVWQLVAPMLAKATSYSNGTRTLESERAAVMAGQKQLWSVIDTDNVQVKNKVVAAGVTSITTNPSQTKTLNIELFGGENMPAFFGLKNEFEAWAKAEGCADILVWGRKGLAKHLKDFELTHYILRKAIV